jgi:hypothetical protein
MQPNGHCRLIARSLHNSKIYFAESLARGNSLGTIACGLAKRAGWMGKPMNASFYFLDRATHIKIVLLPAVLAGVVVAVGESARGDRAAGPIVLTPPTPAQPAQGLKTLSAPVAKPGTRQA